MCWHRLLSRHPAASTHTHRGQRGYVSRRVVSVRALLATEKIAGRVFEKGLGGKKKTPRGPRYDASTWGVEQLHTTQTSRHPRRRQITIPEKARGGRHLYVLSLTCWYSACPSFFRGTSKTPHPPRRPLRRRSRRASSSPRRALGTTSKVQRPLVLAGTAAQSHSSRCPWSDGDDLSRLYRAVPSLVLVQITVTVVDATPNTTRPRSRVFDRCGTSTVI